MVAHHKVLVLLEHASPAASGRPSKRGGTYVSCNSLAVHKDPSMVDPQIVARQRNHALDVALLVVVRIQKHHHVAAMNLAHPVRHLVDEQPVLVLEHRQHARAFHAHRLVEKDDDERRDRNRDHQVAQPRVHAALSLRGRRYSSPVSVHRRLTVPALRSARHRSVSSII